MDTSCIIFIVFLVIKNYGSVFFFFSVIQYCTKKNLFFYLFFVNYKKRERKTTFVLRFCSQMYHASHHLYDHYYY